MYDQHFRTAVEAILKNWTALQLAVSQGSAGAQSQEIANWMVDATVQWFSDNKELEPYEVRDFFDDIISQEMNFSVEDGSTDEIGRLMCDFYSKCKTNSEEDVLKAIRTLPKCDLAKCKVEESNLPVDVSSQISEKMEQLATTPEPKPQPDPEGWEVVTRKKR